MKAAGFECKTYIVMINNYCTLSLYRCAFIVNCAVNIVTWAVFSMILNTNG